MTGTTTRVALRPVSSPPKPTAEQPSTPSVPRAIPVAAVTVRPTWPPPAASRAGTGRSARRKTSTSAAVTAIRAAIHPGRPSHHPTDPTGGWSIRRVRASAVTTTNAVRCHRNAVITRPLAVTTARQTRGRRSQLTTGPRTSASSPISQSEPASNATVGGAMLETRSPGIPTSETGYGPSVVDNTSPASPVPARASPRRLVPGRLNQPSA